MKTHPRPAIILPHRRNTLLYFLFLLLLIAENALLVEASSATEPSTSIVKGGEIMTSQDAPTKNVIFSDVDGTLVHYPKDVNKNEEEGILKLPPSATGMQGIISSQTLVFCEELRRLKRTKLVLVSGMRTATLLKRLPYLPRADAYCSEAGGRIFYPVDPKENDYKGEIVRPVAFDGATDLSPFGIVEDTEWRHRMEGTAGIDCYKDDSIPLSERRGLLWDFGRNLAAQGFVLDTNGYSTCFRVNRKQQKTVTDEDFEALQSGKIAHPPDLATSTNLGCVDFYPAQSGKKNCCAYLAQKFCQTNGESLSKYAICLCDDDNDLEMALACQHAFVPDVASPSMAETIKANPGQLTVTGGPDSELQGTRATEKALELALKRMRAQGQ